MALTCTRHCLSRVRINREGRDDLVGDLGDRLPDGGCDFERVGERQNMV
jgi:hypothetical protein